MAGELPGAQPLDRKHGFVHTGAITSICVPTDGCGAAPLSVGVHLERGAAALSSPSQRHATSGSSCQRKEERHRRYGECVAE